MLRSKGEVIGNVQYFLLWETGGLGPWIRLDESVNKAKSSNMQNMKRAGS